MPQTVRTPKTPKEVEQLVLAEYPGYKSLLYYKELLEKLKSFIRTDITALDEQRIAAKTTQDKNTVKTMKSRHRDEYCMILASALAGLKEEYSLPDEQDGVTKAKLLSDYDIEFNRYEKRSPEVIAAVIEQRFIAAGNKTNHRSMGKYYSAVCIEYET